MLCPRLSPSYNNAVSPFVPLDSRVEYQADENECRLLGVPVAVSTSLVRGIPCEQNFFTGFRGRTAVFETMQVTAAVRAAVNDGQPAYMIRERSIADGMTTLEDSARRLVMTKRTAASELFRLMNDVRMYDSTNVKELVPAGS